MSSHLSAVVGTQLMMSFVCFFLHPSTLSPVLLLLLRLPLLHLPHLHLLSSLSFSLPPFFLFEAKRLFKWRASSLLLGTLSWGSLLALCAWHIMKTILRCRGKYPGNYWCDSHLQTHHPSPHPTTPLQSHIALSPSLPVYRLTCHCCNRHRIPPCTHTHKLLPSQWLHEYVMSWWCCEWPGEG